MFNSTLKKLLVGSGVLALLDFGYRQVKGPGIAILYGHRVLPDRLRENAGDMRVAQGHVCRNDIEAAIKDLRQNGYKIISMDEALSQFEQGRIKQAGVVLTFDDGFKDNVDCLVPLLRQYEAPATFYIAPSVVGTDQTLWFQMINEYFSQYPENQVYLEFNQTSYDLSSLALRQKAALSLMRELQAQHKPEQFLSIIASITGKNFSILPENQHVNWSDLKNLAEDPLFTIGAHSMNHYPLSLCDPELAEYEIVQSIKELESKLDIKVNHFSFPRGFASDFNEIHIEILKKAGIKSSSSTVYGVNRVRPELDFYSLNRIGFPPKVVGNLEQFRLSLSDLPYALNEFKQRFSKLKK